MFVYLSFFLSHKFLPVLFFFGINFQSTTYLPIWYPLGLTLARKYWKFEKNQIITSIFADVTAIYPTVLIIAIKLNLIFLKKKKEF